MDIFSLCRMAKNYKIVDGSVINLGQIISMYQSVRQNVSFELELTGSSECCSAGKTVIWRTCQGFSSSRKRWKTAVSISKSGNQTDLGCICNTSTTTGTDIWMD